MKIVITGGAGFIGSNLIARLLQERIHLVAIDDLSGGTSPSEIPGASDFQIQLAIVDCGLKCNRERVFEVAKNADAIVHLAAEPGVQRSLRHPEFSFQRDARATQQVLEIARRIGAKRFVFASSAGTAVGDSPIRSSEESPPRPLSPYGASKVAGEALCSAYYHSFGLEAVALRFANVYGERSRHKNSFVAQSLSRAIAGKPIQVSGDGMQSRDFVHVADVVEAIFLAATTKAEVAGEVFNIASGISTPINEVAIALTSALSRHGVDASVEPVAARKEVRRVEVDASKFRRLTGWVSTIGLGEGLDRTARWFLKNAKN